MAKARPGRMNFAGIGSSTSLPYLQLMHLAGIDIQEIPYRGGGPGLLALIGGEVDTMVMSLGSAYPHVVTNKIRGIAVTSPTRSRLAPGIPTVAESGYPHFEAFVWNGLAVPAGTPKEIIRKLNQATTEAMSAPSVKAQFDKEGIEIAVGSSEGFREYIQKELARWKQVARESGINPG
jgi:tripartite-type tricarboxylate transporter receptor subunit TctC